MALKEMQIRKATCPPDKKQTKLYDGNGLFVQIMRNGSKLWRFRYSMNGKQRLLSLGRYPEVSLKAARMKAVHMQAMLLEGIDPSSSKKTKGADQDAFESVARAWLAHVSVNWVAKTYRTQSTWLEHDVFPVIGSRQMDDIEAPDLLMILRRVEKSGHDYKLRKLHSILGRIFSYAISHGKAKRNPAKDIVARDLFRPERRQNRPAFTTAKDVGHLMRMLHGYEGSFVVRNGLLLLAYVFTRPGELRQMRWNEIDFERKQWRFHVSKTNVGHVVPMARQVVDILLELQPLTGHSEFVLPGYRTPRRPLSDAAFNAALRSMGINTSVDHCPHGFRAMARTLLAEQGWNTSYIERQLCHKEKDQTVAAYAREKHLPERTKMMQAWADYLDALRDGADIIPLHAHG